MEDRVHAGGSAEPKSNLCFGPFELDLRRGELRKEGRRIRLQEQPFQILRMVLESPGEVVSREEIRKRLWPDETVVEFDHSINAAIKRLRCCRSRTLAATRRMSTSRMAWPKRSSITWRAHLDSKSSRELPPSPSKVNRRTFARSPRPSAS